VLRGEVEQADEYANQLAAISEEHDLPFGVAHAAITRGWVQAQRGNSREGIRVMQEGLDRLAEIGSGMKRTYFLCLLAEACLNADLLDACDAALQEASDFAEDRGQFFYLAEIQRLSGRLAHARGHDEQASNYREQAIETAKRQGAKMLQLRAAEPW
jgi:adenylate cyclase